MQEPHVEGVANRNDPAVMATSIVSISRIASAWDAAASRAACLALESSIAALPVAALVHSDRNTLWRMTIDARAVVVKRFTVRGWRRMIARLRANKAVRSYDAAQELLRRGWATPAPLAAVEVRDGRRLLRAYYCCLDLVHHRDVRALRDGDWPRRTDLIAACGAWAGRLHQQGVLHRDFNATNLLLEEDVLPERFQPALIDLNRVRFGRVGLWAGIGNLLLLGFSGDDARALVAAYAHVRRPRWAQGVAFGIFRVRGWAHDLARWLQRLTRPARRRLGA